jgi:hypothetical protein
MPYSREGALQRLGKIPWLPLFWSLYALSLLFASTHLTLWLDELIQLLSTRDLPFHKMVLAIASDPGQAPIGYLVQSALLRGTDFSALTARIPSILSALTCCFILNRISRLSAVIFALLPLNFRYACEARPYEMALCFSLLALCIFFKLDRQWNIRWYLAYVLFLTLGLYCQPYSIFPAAGCLIWCTLRLRVAARSLSICISAIAIAGLCYLPWYRYSHPMWQKAMTGFVPPSLSTHSFEMVFRELVGGGYFQSSLIVCACLVCLINARGPRLGRLFWVCTIATSVVAPILLDLHFGYFLASRQWIFALPGLAFLTSQSILKCNSD